MLGRDTQGVIIMRLNSGVISTVVAVPHEDEEPVSEEGEQVETSASNGEIEAVTEDVATEVTNQIEEG